MGNSCAKPGEQDGEVYKKTKNASARKSKKSGQAKSSWTWKKNRHKKTSVSGKDKLHTKVKSIEALTSHHLYENNTANKRPIVKTPVVSIGQQILDTQSRKQKEIKNSTHRNKISLEEIDLNDNNDITVAQKQLSNLEINKTRSSGNTNLKVQDNGVKRHDKKLENCDEICNEQDIREEKIEPCNETLTNAIPFREGANVEKIDSCEILSEKETAVLEMALNFKLEHDISSQQIENKSEPVISDYSLSGISCSNKNVEYELISSPEQTPSMDQNIRDDDITRHTTALADYFNTTSIYLTENETTPSPNFIEKINNNNEVFFYETRLDEKLCNNYFQEIVNSPIEEELDIDASFKLAKNFTEISQTQLLESSTTTTEKFAEESIEICTSNSESEVVVSINLSKNEIQEGEKLREVFENSSNTPEKRASAEKKNIGQQNISSLRLSYLNELLLCNEVTRDSNGLLLLNQEIGVTEVREKVIINNEETVQCESQQSAKEDAEPECCSEEHDVTAESIDHDVTAERIDYDVTAERIDRDVTEEGIDHDVTAGSIDHDVTVECIDHDVTVECIDHDVTAESIDHDVTAESIDHDVTAESIDHDVTVECIDHDVTVECIDHDVTEESIDHDVTAESIDHEVTVESIDHDVTGERIVKATNESVVSSSHTSCDDKSHEYHDIQSHGYLEKKEDIEIAQILISVIKSDEVFNFVENIETSSSLDKVTNMEHITETREQLSNEINGKFEAVTPTIIFTSASQHSEILECNTSPEVMQEAVSSVCVFQDDANEVKYFRAEKLQTASKNVAVENSELSESSEQSSGENTPTLDEDKIMQDLNLSESRVEDELQENNETSETITEEQNTTEDSSEIIIGKEELIINQNISETEIQETSEILENEVQDKKLPSPETNVFKEEEQKGQTISAENNINEEFHNNIQNTPEFSETIVIHKKEQSKIQEISENNFDKSEVLKSYEISEVKIVNAVLKREIRETTTETSGSFSELESIKINTQVPTDKKSYAAALSKNLTRVETENITPCVFSVKTSSLLSQKSFSTVEEDSSKDKTETETGIHTENENYQPDTENKSSLLDNSSESDNEPGLSDPIETDVTKPVENQNNDKISLPTTDSQPIDTLEPETSLSIENNELICQVSVVYETNSDQLHDCVVVKNTCNEANVTLRENIKPDTQNSASSKVLEPEKLEEITTLQTPVSGRKSYAEVVRTSSKPKK